MFEADRVFHTNNVNNGESGWYFQTREGIAGVYASMEGAQSMLKEYIKACLSGCCHFQARTARMS